MESVYAQAFLNEVRDALESMKKMRGAFQELDSENWSVSKAQFPMLQLPQFGTVLAGAITCLTISCTTLEDTDENNRFINEVFKVLKEELKAVVESREEIKFQQMKRVQFQFYVMES
jgi:hypothetical protein